MKVTDHAASDALAPGLQSLGVVVVVAGLCLASLGLRAETRTDSKPPAKLKSAVHTTPKAKNSAARSRARGASPGTRHATVKSKSTRRTRSSQSRDARRRSAMRPEAQRVKEIQKALIEAGELHQEPTGAWDGATREAMKRYQQGHGFSVTGLPDSKSLMKMGLGPHSLPADVAMPAATSARLDLDPTVRTPLPGPDNGHPTPSPDPPQEH